MTTHTTAPTHNRLAEIALNLATAPDDWLPRVRLSTQGRWYERLHHDHDHEIWLISWLPGQTTGFHDHGGSSGAFAVALGTLREHDLRTERDIHPGQVRSFGADYIHQVTNTSSAPAVSVHVYSPALSMMNRYDLTDAGLIKVAEERSEQW